MLCNCVCLCLCHGTMSVSTVLLYALSRHPMCDEIIKQIQLQCYVKSTSPVNEFCLENMMIHDLCYLVLGSTIILLWRSIVITICHVIVYT